VQGSFEHFHVLFPIDCEWVKMAPTTYVHKKNKSARALLLLLLFFVSLILVDFSIVSSFSVPSLLPTALIVGFWLLLLMVRKKVMLQHRFDAWEHTN